MSLPHSGGMEPSHTPIILPLGFPLTPSPAHIFLAPELPLPRLKDRTQWPPDFQFEPLRAKKLKVGTALLLQVDQCLFLGFVSASPRGEPYFTSAGKSVSMRLEFDLDRWVCGELFPPRV